MSQRRNIAETESRLRSHLNNKPGPREQMCYALLPTLGPYTRLEPRSPSGGPDGGRDIETLFEGRIKTFVAVGFTNDAVSSHRKAIHKKFLEDLTAATRANPDLRGFVFVTNVPLTPAGRALMKKEARSRNIEHVEVFDFHQLVDSLNRPAGMLTRLQFLDIAMSRDEQLHFLKEMHAETAAKLSTAVESIQRVEFSSKLLAPLRSAEMWLKMKVGVDRSDLAGEMCLLNINTRRGPLLLGFIIDKDLEGRPARGNVFIHMWHAPTKLAAKYVGTTAGFGRWIGASPQFNCFLGDLGITLQDVVDGFATFLATKILAQSSEFMMVAGNDYVLEDCPCLNPGPIEASHVALVPPELSGRDWWTMSVHSFRHYNESMIPQKAFPYVYQKAFSLGF